MSIFNSLELNLEIKRALEDLGFEEPTPIQAETIPHLLTSSRDLIALAQTGTGKTAAYGIPLIQLLDINSPQTQVLILCPTRELCIQIAKDVSALSKYIKGLNVTAVYGGAPVETQAGKLRKGSQIVVGTPGRALDLIKSRKLNVSNIRWVVLDEADEMLSMGFKDELDGILATTPAQKQTMLFSATMPEPIRTITKKYMSDPVEITSGKMNQGADNVIHNYYMVHADDRYETLKRIADINPDIYGIIFCRTRNETKEISDKLMNDGYNADALHGDLSQAQRDIVMNRFRDKHLQLLVATDVAARGLDVNDLSHIINYNLPDDPDIYIHRSGRTGRAGKSGISISIVHSRAGHQIKILEQKIGKPFTHELVPEGRAICEKRLFNLIDKLDKVEVDEEQIKPFLPDIFSKFNNLSKEEIIKKFVWVEFNSFLNYYKNSPDLNVTVHKENNRKKDTKNKDNGRIDRNDRNSRNDRNDRIDRNNRSDRSESYKNRRSNLSFSRFYINIGSNQAISPIRLMGLINEKMRTKNIEIGQIEIMKKFSFFEIDSEFTSQVLEAFEGANYKNERLIVELVKIQKKQFETKSDNKNFYESNQISNHHDRRKSIEKLKPRKKRH
jgi:ATP-dependent RNA helicase DeaD